MKNTILYYLTAGLLILSGCNNSNIQSAPSDSLSTNVDTIMSSQCYIAIDGKDTAYLNTKSSLSGKVTGELKVNYSFKPKNEGTIEGEFKGDTLFVDYTFITGTYDRKVNKNPMAFLKSGDRLIVGIGVIETTLGKSYFVKDKPINFEKGRFKFDSIECLN